VFGIGFGALDTALNAHASRHFGARDINWMHASYGLGATLGPLLVTALLSAGRSWRQIYGVMALVLAILAGVHALARRRWQGPASAPDPRPADPPAPQAAALGALTFTAVETGIESGAGIWGYLFLTAGRGLPPAAAGIAVAAYWAMMCAGRVALGPLAERRGPARVLTAAVTGVPLGAALMTLPGPGVLAVAGLMLLGLAAAPVFPLFTLTTGTTRMVSLQVAASAVGGAALPAGLGLLIGAAGPRLLAPSLLALGLAMAGLYAFGRRPGTA
jgi:fucose permease